MKESCVEISLCSCVLAVSRLEETSLLTDWDLELAQTFGLPTRDVMHVCGLKKSAILTVLE